MILKIGVWFSEDWLRAGPRLAEAGFKLVSATTDPHSAGEYQHCVFDYVADREMEWDELVQLIAEVKAMLEPLGQDLAVRVARSG